MEIKESSEKEEIILNFDKNVYSIEAILKAIYKFTNECYIQINSSDANSHRISFSLKENSSDLKKQINEFSNELIDQQVRFNLDKANHKIKEMIIRKAFFPFENQSDE